jgi:putative aldouronate transport system substrate-binding protein
MAVKLKVARVVLLVVLVYLFLSCGKQGGLEEAKAETPVLRFTMMANFNQPEPPSPNTDLMKYIKETLNADIEIQWYPTSMYTDKLNVQLAASDLPDTCVARGHTKTPNMIEAYRDGVFWPLDKYLNNPSWSGLDKLSDVRLSRISFGGHVYGLPIERELPQIGVLYRQDWLDNLRLKPPTNMDEVWEIIKAFTERDPDGNGKNDTTGLSMKGRNLGAKVTHAAIFYGGHNAWWYDPETKTVRSEVEENAYLKAMDFHREAYSKGYFVQDLVELNDEYLPLQQGRAGLVFFSDVIDIMDSQIRVSSVFPDAKIGFTQLIHTPDGQLAQLSHLGYNGGFVFPKTSIKTEARLEEVLKFFDILGSDQNILTMRRGLKDKHYMVENGYVVSTPDQIATFRDKDFPDAALITPFGVTKPIPEKLADSLSQAVQDSIDAYNGILYLDISNVYISETSVKLGNTLGNILTDARMKYVIGELDLPGWMAAVQKWREAGGDKVKEELTAAYLANPIETAYRAGGL